MPAPLRDATAELLDLAAVHAASSTVLRAVDELAARPLDAVLAGEVARVLGGELVARGRDAYGRLLREAAEEGTPGGQPVTAPPGCSPGTSAGRAPTQGSWPYPDARGGVRSCRRVPGPTTQAGAS